MKISFLTPHLKLYGGNRRIMEIANRLVEKGHDVTIFHSDGSRCDWMECKFKIKSQDQIFNEQHDAVINIWAPFCSLIKKVDTKLKVFYILALYERRFLKRGLWNLLLLFLSDLYFHGKNRLSMVPLFYRIYSYIKPKDSTKNPVLYFSDKPKESLLSKFIVPNAFYLHTLKYCLRCSCLKMSNSTWMYYWLKDNLNIDTKLLIGGINKEMFHPVETKRENDKIRILCSGDTRERKGTDTIIKAIEIAREIEPRIILDSYYGKGIPQEKMAEVYSSADIFVDAQWYAGWNNPVAEAMACKVPVVCTDIGGVKDFAFHEKTALLVSPQVPDALASAILRLIKNRELRERLRENAYQHIRQFDWNKSAENLEKILISELKLAEFNPAYTGSRKDILDLIPPNVNKVLDVGCSIGTLGKDIKNKREGAKVIGVESDQHMAEIARNKLDYVIVRDVENIDLGIKFPLNYFDCMIFADVLEHLRNPWKVLKDIVNFLDNDGIVISSLPNVRHYSVILNLIRGSWPYRERGIQDKTHLRFFTLRNIHELFKQADLVITEVKRNYRIIEKPHYLNRYSKYLALPFLREFLTFQYIVVAKKK
jgi:glycosyltransferase involved in cell wall biosynthesis/ubiquinone/menaquinone biosynthesis C-methylase UbiE